MTFNSLSKMWVRVSPSGRAGAPGDFFRHRRWLDLVARGDGDLVTFHHAGQDFGWACRQDAGAQLFGRTRSPPLA
jgi:hypothetical protein